MAAPEGDTGKSTIALGLLRILAGTVQRVGIFRPVTVAPRSTDDEPARDRIVEMLLQHTTVDLKYEDCVGVTNARVHRDRDAALTEIVDKYHAVARQCDVVVILGTDYTGVPSPTEFEFNATLAVNLGAPVLLVIRGAAARRRRSVPTPASPWTSCAPTTPTRWASWSTAAMTDR